MNATTRNGFKKQFAIKIDSVIWLPIPQNAFIKLAVIKLALYIVPYSMAIGLVRFEN